MPSGLNKVHDLAASDGKVYARALKGFLNLGEALGAQAGMIAERVGIDLQLMDVPDATISVAQYYRLHEELVAQTGSADFGLLSGRVFFMESAHLHVYLALASKTLRDWLNLLPSMASFIGDIGLIKVRRQDSKFALEWHPRSAPDPSRCTITDSILSAAVLQMDAYCLLPVKPCSVDLSYARPANIAALEDAFHAPLRFDQPVSALHYDSKVLNYPQLHVSTRIYDAVEQEYSAFYKEETSATDPFSLSLHSAIRRQLPVGECSIDSVANDLNVSRRTLQRRLNERNTNFQQLLQQVKSKLAVRYLHDNRLSIIEIALLLGYADPSSFSAAFKSWRGCTPSAFRRKG